MQKKPPLVNILLIVLIGLLSTLGGILSNVASGNIPLEVKPYLGLVWPLLGLVALALIVLTVLQTVQHSTTEQTLLKPSNQNRQIMLARVNAFWIKDVLDQSLHGAALIALGLREQSDALENPWHLVLQQSDQSQHSLPPGTRIMQVYDDAGGELLILGEPGSGKTTLLLELTRDLLDRAKKDDTNPMPVVFNLSSWAVKHQTISEWLIGELNTKYQVPHKLGQSWVKNDQILPLLDGLDEVTKEYRTACIDAINAYRREHLASMVVCSRSSDYLDQSKRISLQRTIMIQPLTTEQIDEYLSSAGGKLEAVRVALHDDPDLQKLAETPLMLSVLTLAYHGMAIEDLVEAPLAIRQHQVFATYIRRMLEHRGIKKRYTSQKTIRRLAWLAWQMTRHSQTEFYMERIQPYWLTERRTSQPHHKGGVERIFWLISGLVLWLIGGLISGTASGLIIGLFMTQTFGFKYGLIGGLLSGALIGLFVVLNSTNESPDWKFFLREVYPYPLRQDQARILYKRNFIGRTFGLVGGLFIGLVSGLLIGLVSGLLSGLIGGLINGLIEGLIDGLIGGVIVGLISGLIFLIAHFEGTEIRPAEVLVWSWATIKRRVLLILIILMELYFKEEITNYEDMQKYLTIMKTSIISWRREPIIAFFLLLSLLAILVIARFFVLVFIFLVGIPIVLLGGISSTMLDEHILITPNQGIRRSGRNCVLLGLISGLGATLVFGLIGGLFNGVSSGLTVGLTLGLTLGLITALLNGGVACIKHIVLRLLLWHAGYMPWNYNSFLDFATECLLLRKVGGGYIYVHRLLQDYFASLNYSVP